MVYRSIIDASKTHFIYVSSNYDDNYIIRGTKINIKTYIPRDVSNNYYLFEHNNFYNKDNFANEKFKNRVILSARESGDNKRPMTLLTQQNIYHNIKFINKDANFSKPRILFMKHNTIGDISNDKQYLINPINNIIDLAHVKIDDISYNIKNTDADIIDVVGSNTANLKHFIYYLNYYKNYENSDYYKIKFSDFIDLSYALRTKNSISDISYNKLSIAPKVIEIDNDFSGNFMINYDENNFKNIYNFNDLSINTIKKLEIGASVDDVSYNSDNILVYSKLDNKTTFNLDYKYPGANTDNIIDGYKDASINFVVFKNYDYYTVYSGKILFGSNFTYLNSRILDYNSNFYNTNSAYKTGFDNGMVYLSLGNSLTGITQKDIFTKMKLDLNIVQTTNETSNQKNYINTNRIYFSNSVSAISVPSTLKDNMYLLDSSYNYSYTNLTYNNINESNIKKLDINLLNYYHGYNLDLSNNVYGSRFYSLDLLNNEISNNYFETKYNSNNIQFNITDPSDISYSSLEYKFNFNDIGVNTNNASSLFGTPLSNNILNYDYRYNYSSDFPVDIYFTANYGYTSSDLSFIGLDDYKSSLLLNFHKIVLTSNIETTAASDFTNVDCVFIYHDPEKTTDPSFQYPYNNVEISNNPNIDTLSRAIELLPGAKTATSNSVFVPARNASNLSRKHIQGLIGMNNIPRLLSIEPYDNSIIEGRGFLNQYQISDTCLSYEDKVKNKVNIHNKKALENSNQNNRRQSFANMVRSRNRRTARQECLDNLASGEATIQNIDYSSITNYRTPFTNVMWKRTHRENNE